MTYFWIMRQPAALGAAWTVGVDMLLRRLRGLVADKSGQDQVEYAVFIGLMALAAALALTDLSEGITAAYSRLSDALEAAKNCANPNPGQFQGRSPCAL